MKRFIDIISGQFVAFISNLKDLLEVFVSLPDTIFGGGNTTSLLSRILLVLFKIVWLPVYAIGWLFLAPLRLFTDFSDARRKDFMYGLPALVFAVALSVIVVIANANADEIDSRYRRKGELALVARDFTAAKTYFGRLLSKGERGTQDKGDIYNWALSLLQTGESKRAMAIFESLAPSDKAGYPRAHKVQALALAQQLQNSSDGEVLKNLRWHLDNCRDSSPEINQCWAVYHMMIGNPEDALPYLETNVEKNPAALLDIARVYKGLRNESAEQRTLHRAEQVFRQQLKEDATNSRVRIQLANVLVSLGDIEEAESIMVVGTRIAPSKLMSQSMADFYVMRHDRARADGQDFETQFEFLRRAMTIDVNFVPVYQRFITLYQESRESDDLSQVKDAMMGAVSGDKPTSLAHFSLSNILWLEGSKKEAEWHLEQAYKLDNNLIIVLNNLAWMLAYSETPDLDRATELINKVLSIAPNDVRFRDTYANILMKQEKYEEALIEFQKVMLTIQDKKAVHKNLAFIYEKLGQTELARRHAINAGAEE